MNKQYFNNLSFTILGAAIEVHRELGPGLLESLYHKCMKQELTIRGLNFCSEMIIPITYKNEIIETQLRCDLFVEDIFPVEIKSVLSILPVHEAQLLTYMKLLQAPKGLLINFNCTNLFREGQKTFVNEHYSELSD